MQSTNVAANTKIVVVAEQGDNSQAPSSINNDTNNVMSNNGGEIVTAVEGSGQAPAAEVYDGGNVYETVDSAPIINSAFSSAQVSEHIIK